MWKVVDTMRQAPRTPTDESKRAEAHEFAEVASVSCATLPVDRYSKVIRRYQLSTDKVAGFLHRGEEMCQWRGPTYVATGADVDAEVRRFRQEARYLLGRSNNNEDRASIYRVVGKVSLHYGDQEAGVTALLEAIELGDHQKATYELLVPSYVKCLMNNSIPCLEFIEHITDSRLTVDAKAELLHRVVLNCIDANSGLHFGLIYAARIWMLCRVNPQQDAGCTQVARLLERDVRQAFVVRGASRSARDLFKSGAIERASGLEMCTISELLDEADQVDRRARAYNAEGIVRSGCAGAMVTSLTGAGYLMSLSATALAAIPLGGVIAWCFGGVAVGIALKIKYHLAGFGNTK